VIGLKALLFSYKTLLCLFVYVENPSGTDYQCNDLDEKKQEEADQEAEAELIAAGGFGRVRKDLGLRVV
jgi:hypothetical protein